MGAYVCGCVRSSSVVTPFFDLPITPDLSVRLGSRLVCCPPLGGRSRRQGTLTERRCLKGRGGSFLPFWPVIGLVVQCFGRNWPSICPFGQPLGVLPPHGPPIVAIEHVA